MQNGNYDNDDSEAIRRSVFRIIYIHVIKHVFLYTLAIELLISFILTILGLALDVYDPRIFGINYNLLKVTSTLIFGSLSFLVIIKRLFHQNNRHGIFIVFIHLILETIITGYIIEYIAGSKDPQGVLIANLVNFCTFLVINLFCMMLSLFKSRLFVRYIPSVDRGRKEEISNIPVYNYRDGKLIGKDNLVFQGSIYNLEECVICLEEFKNSKKIIVLDCKHYLHEDCGKEWLTINSNCPICREGFNSVQTV